MTEPTHRVSAWVERIAAVLRDDGDEVGRAGATQLTKAADDLRDLAAAPSELAASTDAIVRLIADDEPKATERKTEYWTGLVFLAQSLPAYDKRPLLHAFRDRLLGRNRLPEELLPIALNGFIACGGRLSPAELGRLSNIRNQAPIVWLNAAIMSQQQTWAYTTALNLLSSKKLDVRTLVLSLDRWRDVWPLDQDFADAVRQLEEAASPSYRPLFRRWRSRRGYGPTTASGLLSEQGLRVVRRASSAWKESNRGSLVEAGA